MSPLTEDQLKNILEVVIEDYGTQLTKNEVEEVIGLILEDISGLELIDSHHLRCVINDIRKKYYVSVS